MKILVTGAAGFTGSNLTDRLIDRGHDVIALAHKSRGFSDEIEKHGAKVIFGDIADEKLMDDLMKGIDIVFNIAATFRNISASEKDYESTNERAAHVLAQAAIEHKVKRFIHCSTCGVHGETKKIPSDETAPLAPLDHYQKTKLQGELVIRDHIKKGLPGVIIRPAGIYGPRDRRLLKLFRLIKRGRFVMLGSGKVYYHMCYIDNLLDAFELSMRKEDAIGKAFLVADENYITLKDLVAKIADALEVVHPRLRFPVWPVWLAGLICEGICKPLRIEPPLFRRRVNFFIKDRAFDISKAKDELGYLPKVDLEAGLKKTVRWYEDEGWL